MGDTPKPPAGDFAPAPLVQAAVVQVVRRTIERVAAAKTQGHCYRACKQEEGGGALPATDQRGQDGVHQPYSERDDGEPEKLLGSPTRSI